MPKKRFCFSLNHVTLLHNTSDTLVTGMAVATVAISLQVKNGLFGIFGFFWALLTEFPRGAAVAKNCEQLMQIFFPPVTIAFLVQNCQNAKIFHLARLMHSCI